MQAPPFTSTAFPPLAKEQMIMRQNIFWICWRWTCSQRRRAANTSSTLGHDRKSGYVLPRDQREALPERSGSNKKIRAGDDSKKSHPASSVAPRAWLVISVKILQPFARGKPRLSAHQRYRRHGDLAQKSSVRPKSKQSLRFP